MEVETQHIAIPLGEENHLYLSKSMPKTWRKKKKDTNHQTNKKLQQKPQPI
jgi:hypothetical protein